MFEKAEQSQRTHEMVALLARVIGLLFPRSDAGGLLGKEHRLVSKAAVKQR